MQNGCSDASAQRALCGSSVPDTAVQDGGRVGRAQTHCTRRCDRATGSPPLHCWRDPPVQPCPGPLGKGADSRGTSCHLCLLWWQSTAPRLSPILLVPVTLGGTWGRRASNNRRSCSYLIFSPHSSRKSLPISLTALVTAAFCFSTFTRRAHSFLHLPFQLSFHFPSLFKSLPRVSARPTDSHPGLPTAGETRWCRQASPLNSVSPSLLHSVAPVSAQFMHLGSVFHEQSLFSLWTQFGIWCLVSQVLI